MRHMDRSSFDTEKKLKSVLLDLVTKKTQKIEPMIICLPFFHREKNWALSFGKDSSSYDINITLYQLSQQMFVEKAYLSQALDSTHKTHEERKWEIESGDLGKCQGNSLKLCIA